MDFSLTMDGLQAIHEQQQNERKRAREDVLSAAGQGSLTVAAQSPMPMPTLMPTKHAGDATKDTVVDGTGKRPAIDLGVPPVLEMPKEDAAAVMDRVRNGFHYINNHFLGLSAAAKEAKKLEMVMSTMSCSEARAKQIVEEVTQQAADKLAADDAKAWSAMAARSHESGTVWAVELSPYNKYRDVKPKLHSTHLTEQDATAVAKRWWTTETHGVDGLDVLSGPDQPYEANACIEYGAGVMTVAVIRVDVLDLKGPMLKKALQLRGASTKGSTKELSERLRALVA